VTGVQTCALPISEKRDERNHLRLAAERRRGSGPTLHPRSERADGVAQDRRLTEDRCGAQPARAGRRMTWGPVLDTTGGRESPLHQEVTMRRIVASLSAVLMLAAV